MIMAIQPIVFPTNSYIDIKKSFIATNTKSNE